VNDLHEVGQNRGVEHIGLGQAPHCLFDLLESAGPQLSQRRWNVTGYILNIEEETLQNNYFRVVLYTAQHSQLVLMSLNPTEEIGVEVHEAERNHHTQADVAPLRQELHSRVYLEA
jgi:hypothetical protein